MQQPPPAASTCGRSDCRGVSSLAPPAMAGGRRRGSLRVRRCSRCRSARRSLTRQPAGRRSASSARASPPATRSPRTRRRWRPPTSARAPGSPPSRKTRGRSRRRRRRLPTPT
ncbi:hypothetical protein BU14_0103s0045 [Porphyra umbilicalis]|uniref:Uncharacterized protein n=1 Tax=Porphyra umbilicalis TaxID=2786 RepID=A0A1X6PDI1_PORUM|nr:hypothetical protein BU14_0103s0045 [Porphyra umbilicalis]|eukprot:OSX78703.1 hypothetical protein BU14_0103s0045 [Porphyra umbilicalis]